MHPGWINIAEKDLRAASSPKVCQPVPSYLYISEDGQMIDSDPDCLSDVLRTWVRIAYNIPINVIQKTHDATENSCRMQIKLVRFVNSARNYEGEGQTQFVAFVKNIVNVCLLIYF